MGLGAKEDTAVSSAELVNGSPLILPGQLLRMPDRCLYDKADGSTRTSFVWKLTEISLVAFCRLARELTNWTFAICILMSHISAFT
jgi:hypothetical protein